MNALLNLYSPILQWIFPIVLINLKGLSFFGEFALLIAFITPITVVLSLSTKNLYFTKALNKNSEEFVFHLGFKNLITLLLLLSSYFCFLFELNTLSLIFFMKMIDFKIDLIIIKRASTNFIGRLDITLITLSVFFCILSIINESSLYFSVSCLCSLITFLTYSYKSSLSFLMFKNISFYLKRSVQSTVYPLLGALGVYFQRLFVLNSSSAEFLGMFSIFMQFAIAWSLFIQSAFVHLNFRLFRSRGIFLVLFFICSLGLYFLEDVTNLLFDLEEINIAFVILLASVFLFIFIEFRYFYLFHINKLNLLWIPQFISSLFMMYCAYFLNFESHNYLLLVVFCYYLLRCLTFYILNKINKEITE